MGLLIQIYAQEIIPLLNLAIANSFANIKTNWKAIAMCGWCPENVTYYYIQKSIIDSMQN